MWLRTMIDHHEGAVLMAEQVTQRSVNPEVTALAAQVITAQEREIDAMSQLLPQDRTTVQRREGWPLRWSTTDRRMRCHRTVAEPLRPTPAPRDDLPQR